LGFGRSDPERKAASCGGNGPSKGTKKRDPGTRIKIPVRRTKGKGGEKVPIERVTPPQR